MAQITREEPMAEVSPCHRAVERMAQTIEHMQGMVSNLRQNDDAMRAIGTEAESMSLALEDIAHQLRRVIDYSG
jgi:hypothetical protein